MIPKIIHQFWIGPKEPPYILMKTWKDLNPDWEYKFWNEKMISSHFPRGLQNQRQFDEMQELCGKCDIARYEILNKFGGFFIDADSIGTSKLDDFVLTNDSFSCYENEVERGNLVAIGYLASSKENDLMKLLIKGIGTMNIKKIIKTPEPNPWEPQHLAWQLVGSAYLSKTIVKFKYTNISIYPSYYFIPEHYTGTKYTGPAKSYGRQFWGSTKGSLFKDYDLTKLKL